MATKKKSIFEEQKCICRGAIVGKMSYLGISKQDLAERVCISNVTCNKRLDDPGTSPLSELWRIFEVLGLEFVIRDKTSVRKPTLDSQLREIASEMGYELKRKYN